MSEKPEAPDSVETLIRLILLAFLLWLMGAFTGCQTHREQYPWNMPKSWEYNKHFEGFQSLYDTYKTVFAPKGMIWDPLMQNYQQDLRNP